jgi:uncharacterized membrane protein YdjX (TVP38/TMEM64 family)
MIFLMRMTMVPFSLMSYLLGVTSVSFKNYLLGTSAVCVHVSLWVYIGSTLTMFDDDYVQGGKHTTTKLEKAVLTGQVILAIALGVYIARVAKREFEKGVQEAREKEERDEERSPLKRIKL